MIQAAQPAGPKSTRRLHGNPAGAAQPGGRGDGEASTKAGHAWEITETEPDDYACGCPGARYRSTCKHIEGVRLFVETEGELRRAEAVGGKALADAIYSVATTMARAYQTGP